MKPIGRLDKAQPPRVEVNGRSYMERVWGHGVFLCGADVIGREMRVVVGAIRVVLSWRP
jgi:hypothetical protein